MPAYDEVTAAVQAVADRERLIAKAILLRPHCSSCHAMVYEVLATGEMFSDRADAIDALPDRTECCGVPFLTPCREGCINADERDEW